MNIPITQNDILFAVAGAAVIFFSYRFVFNFVRFFISRTNIIPFDPDQLDNVLQNCYRTFPIDSLEFGGNTYQRGTTVRVTSTRKTAIEGQFIGTNQAQMLCVLTKSTVVAQELSIVSEIEAVYSQRLTHKE